MIVAQRHVRPRGLALCRGARAGMDVILHVGAHRTGSTSFQRYMRDNHVALARAKIGFWGPKRTRGGLLSGLADVPHSPADRKAAQRAVGRVQVNLARARKDGLRQLVVSDENLLGLMRRNLTRQSLYRYAGDRMARFGYAFGDSVKTVSLQIRSLDDYWESVISYAVAMGDPVPDADKLDRLVTQPRGWRHVVTDMACAFPDAAIVVTPFERMAGQANRLLETMTGVADLPRRGGNMWVNQRPNLADLRAQIAQREERATLPAGEGPWRPFDSEQRAALREAYADDLFWLRAGADGLASIREGTSPAEIISTVPGYTPGDTRQVDHPRRGADLRPDRGQISRGQTHDTHQGRMV